MYEMIYKKNPRNHRATRAEEKEKYGSVQSTYDEPLCAVLCDVEGTSGSREIAELELQLT